MNAATATKPIIIHVSEAEFIAKYGEQRTSEFIPLFNKYGVSGYLDRLTRAIYIVDLF